MGTLWSDDFTALANGEAIDNDGNWQFHAFAPGGSSNTALGDGANNCVISTDGATGSVRLKPDQILGDTGSITFSLDVTNVHVSNYSRVVLGVRMDRWGDVDTGDQDENSDFHRYPAHGWYFDTYLGRTNTLGLYRGKASGGGTLTTPNGMSITANVHHFRIEWEKNGTDDWQIRLRKWADLESEPATWHVDYNDTNPGDAADHADAYFGIASTKWVGATRTILLTDAGVVVGDLSAGTTHQGVADAGVAVDLTAAGTAAYSAAADASVAVDLTAAGTVAGTVNGIATTTIGVDATADASVTFGAVADASVAVDVTASGGVLGTINGAAHLAAAVAVGSAGSIYPATVNLGLTAAGTVTAAAVSGVADTSVAVALGGSSNGVVSGKVATTWLPSELTDLDLWLDAATPSTVTLESLKVAGWADRDGGPVEFLSGDIAHQPTLVSGVQNGLSVIRFDGGNDYMEAGDVLDGTENVRVIAWIVDITTVKATRVIAKYNSIAQGGDFRWETGISSSVLQASGNGDGHSAISSGDPAATGWVIMVAAFTITAAGTTTNVQAWINGVDQGLASFGPDDVVSLSNTNTVWLGASSNSNGTAPLGSYLDGDLGEIIGQDGALTQREEIEGYLAHRWGLASLLPGGHVYKTNPPGAGSIDVAMAASGTVSVRAVADLAVDVEASANATVTGPKYGVANLAVAVELQTAATSRLSAVADLSVEVDATAAGTAARGAIADATVAVALGAAGSLSAIGAADASVAVGLSAQGSLTGQSVARIGVEVDASAAATAALVAVADLTAGVGLVADALLTRGSDAHVATAVVLSATGSLTVGSPVERYWAPDKLSGLDLWLDAADSTTLTLDTADVITWADKSSAGQDFTQGTPSRRPVVASAYQNGLDAIQFTRANEEHLSGGDALDTSTGTRMIGVILEIGDDSVHGGILAKYRNTLDDFRWRLYLDSSGTPSAKIEASWSGPGDISAVSNGAQSTGWVLLVAEITTGTSAQLWWNGVNQGYSEAGASTSGNQPYTAFIGTSNGTTGTDYLASYCLNGYIGEIVSADGVVVQREELEGYLAHRWGLASLLPVDHIFKAETPPGSSVSVKLGAAARIAQYAQADTDVNVGLTAAATVAYRAVADQSVAVELGAAGSNTLAGVSDTTVEVDLAAAASAVVPGAADASVGVDAGASGTVVRGAAADTTVAVDLSAAGSVAVAGVADTTVSVDLTAAATRVAGGATDASVAVDLGAIGTVTQAVHQGIADASVAIDLSAAGTVLQAVHQGIADIEVDVEVGASGSVLRAASADLSTDVDVGADATITSGAVADLTAEVDLGAAGSVTARTAGDATVAVGMTARGSLMGQSVARIDVAVDLYAAATLAVAGVADLDTEIDLAAAGSVTTASVADVGVDVDLTAVGTITHGAVTDTTVDVDLAAVGTITHGAVADTTVDVDLTADGTLVEAVLGGVATIEVDVDLAAAASVTATGIADTTVEVDLTADGTVVQAVVGGVADVSVDVGLGADGSILSGATADTTVDVGLAAAGTLIASGVADTTVEIDVSADGTTGGVQSGVADTTVDVEVGATCRVTLGGSAHCSVHVDMQADGSLPTSADIALAVAILARGTGGSAPLPVVVKRVGIRDRHRFGVRDRWRVGKPYGGPS